jgi:hypothetical protein
MDILSIRSANYSKQDEPLYKRWFEFADTGLNTIPYIFCQEKTICDEEVREEGRKEEKEGEDQWFCSSLVPSACHFCATVC